MTSRDLATHAVGSGSLALSTHGVLDLGGVSAEVSPGWGTSPWGTSPWGGVGTTMAVANAFATAENAVEVTLTLPPLDRSPSLLGDVRNLASWQVQTLDPEAVLRVVAVSPVDPPLRWSVQTLERLPPGPDVARVRAAGLLDAAGLPIGTPNLADFVGIGAAAESTPDRVAAGRRLATRDLANVPAPDGEALGGTLRVVGGDYALEEGPSLVRKLIVRRLVTTPGDFFHLPDYGAGLRVKEPVPVGDLVRLQAEIRRQVLLEREVSDATVALTQDGGSLVVRVGATLRRTGQRVDVAVRARKDA